MRVHTAVRVSKMKNITRPKIPNLGAWRTILNIKLLCFSRCVPELLLSPLPKFIEFYLCIEMLPSKNVSWPHFSWPTLYLNADLLNLFSNFCMYLLLQSHSKFWCILVLLHVNTSSRWNKDYQKLDLYSAWSNTTHLKRSGMTQVIRGITTTVTTICIMDATTEGSGVRTPKHLDIAFW